MFSRSRLLLTLLSVVLFGVVPALAVAASSTVQVWWPTNGAHVTGTQPFKAMVSGLDVSQYDMFWQVDGGQWNWMDNNYTDYQHKEADVDVSGWNWHGTGPYTLNFIARQNGTVISEQRETIYIDAGGSVTTVSAPVAAPTQETQVQTQPAAPIVVSAPALQIQPVAPATVSAPTVTAVPASGTLYVQPNSAAANQAKAWASSNPTGAALMRTLAAQSTAVWFGNWNNNVENDVRSLVNAAATAGSIPVLVAYNIPQRDCGGFSSGGTDNPSGYQSWINSFAQGLGNTKAIVVLEPDALAGIGCLSSTDQTTRLQLLANAVNTLKKDQNVKVYIDAGHSGWIDSITMANELKQAGLANADGFSLNVSNFMPTADETNYGQQVSVATGGKHFVVDTSRNANNANGQWCNPWGAGIGQKPTLQTGSSLVDGYLWVKTPGESDGWCNGGPSAGTWWPSYAVSLVQNAR